MWVLHIWNRKEDEVHDLARSPLEGGCDVFAHEESSSLSCDNTPLDHPVFLLCVYNLHCPPSLILMCPLIILYYVILKLIWAMRTTYLICLVGMLLIFYS